MTNEEMAEQVLQTFEVGKVAMILRKTKATWWFPRGERVPTQEEVRTRAKKMLLDLLKDESSVIATSSGGLIVSRRGSRLGIGFCPVTSQEFP